jgi:tetratricopeptide (TPR) repeat protein
VPDALAPHDAFISFAPEDEPLLVELEKGLAVLQRTGVIRAWHRGRIGAGEERAAAIAARLESATVVLLLVSRDFLASDDCYEVEMTRAIERHSAGDALVVPIVVRACDWQTAAFGGLEPLPRGGTPVTSWKNRDEAWEDVIRELRGALAKRGPASTGSPAITAGPEIQREARSPGSPLAVADRWAHHLRAGMPRAGSEGALLQPLERRSGQPRFHVPSDALPHAGPGVRGEGIPPNNLGRRPEHFVGREAEIELLQRILAHERHASVVQSQQVSIFGLGGIGKTTLVLEYAYRHLDRYPGGVFWVDAEGDPLMRMLDLAEVLRAVVPSMRSRLHALPDARDELARLVRLVLQNHDEPLLLVLDNVDGPGWDQLLPAGRVDVLATTRDERLTIGRPAVLDVLPEGDAKQLAMLLAGPPSSPAEELALGRVLDELGGLAVAVEMAARAVRRWARRSWAVYERHLRRGTPALLSRRELHSKYPRSAFTAIALSVDRCRPNTPERRMLEVAAFLAPERMPIEAIQGASAIDPASIEAAEALATLKGLGLIGLDEEAGTMSMHRLIQAVVRDRLAPGDQKAWAEAAVLLVDHEFPECSDDVETWPTCARWLPHALAAASHAKDYGVAREARAQLLARFAVYLQGRASYAEAKGYLEQALALHELVYGAGDPRVAAVLRSLGSVLHDLADLGGARASFERALAIDVATFGPDHPDVARDVNDLGSVLMDQGDLTGARKHLERALAIDEATYGPDDPSVAIRLNNLGALFRDLGDFASARVHLERALAIYIRAYGPDHLTVAIGRTDLGRLLYDLGDLTGAREQFEEALKIDEHTYGCYHPRFALALNNRGRVLRDSGDLAGALSDFKRALAIVEATYGPDHPDVARDINNLGSVLRDLGDLEGARESFARVLKIAEATYGPDHPAVAIGCNNLGSVLQALGDLPGARDQLERALGIAQVTYGPDHPVVASIVNNLGRVLQALGDLPGAWQQIERAVAIATKALGPTHPSVQIFSRNLARVGDALGERPGGFAG